MSFLQFAVVCCLYDMSFLIPFNYSVKGVRLLAILSSQRTEGLMLFLSMPNMFLVCSYLWGSPLVNSSPLHTVVMFTITSPQINKGLLLLFLLLSFFDDFRESVAIYETFLLRSNMSLDCLGFCCCCLVLFYPLL